MPGSNYHVFDPETGAWTNTFFDCSTIFFNEIFWESMINELYLFFDSAAVVFLYNSGQGIGRKLAKLILAKGLTPETLGEFIEQYYYAGWGILKTDPVDPDQPFSQEYRIRSTNSFFCNSCVKYQHDLYCSFQKGIFAAILTGITGIEIECEREECTYHDDVDESVFVMKPRQK